MVGCCGFEEKYSYTLLITDPEESPLSNSLTDMRTHDLTFWVKGNGFELKVRSMGAEYLHENGGQSAEIIFCAAFYNMKIEISQNSSEKELKF